MLSIIKKTLSILLSVVLLMEVVSYKTVSVYAYETEDNNIVEVINTEDAVENETILDETPEKEEIATEIVIKEETQKQEEPVLEEEILEQTVEVETQIEPVLEQEKETIKKSSKKNDDSTAMIMSFDEEAVTVTVHFYGSNNKVITSETLHLEAGSEITIKDIAAAHDNGGQNTLVGFTTSSSESRLYHSMSTIEELAHYHGIGTSLTVNSDVELYPVYLHGSATVTYTVTFVGGDHGQLNGTTSFTVESGSSMPAAPEVNEDTGYRFTGWAPSYDSSSTVTENLEFVAQYELIEYKVTYYVDGEVYATDKYTVESVADLDLRDELDDTDTHVFLGWYSDEACTTKATSIPSDSASDLSFYGKFAKKLVVNFYGKSNEKNPEKVVETYEGATITLPRLDIKHDNSANHPLAGWTTDINYRGPQNIDALKDKDFYYPCEENYHVTKDTDFYAVFEGGKTLYTITWKNGDTVLAQNKEDYGKTPVYDGSDPTKDATEQYSYKFSGWDPEVVAVTGDATYYAQFTEVSRYTITFVDEDDKQLSSAKYDEGTKAADILAPTPSKTGNAEYSYEFIGWDKTIADVTADATYKATYKQIKNKYTVTYKAGDHGAFETVSTEVEYGSSTPAAPELTCESGYRFDSWDKEIAETVTENVTYTARFVLIPVPAPEKPDTPVTPITPVTPVTPETVIPRVDPTPVTPEETTPEKQESDTPVTPVTPDQTEVIPEEDTPAATIEGYWAVGNLIMVAGAAVLSVVTALAKTRSKDEDEDEDPFTRRIWPKFLAGAITVVSLLFFLFTEDMSLPMKLFDRYTIVNLVLLLTHIPATMLGLQKLDVEEENETVTE